MINFFMRYRSIFGSFWTESRLKNSKIDKNFYQDRFKKTELKVRFF